MMDRPVSTNDRDNVGSLPRGALRKTALVTRALGIGDLYVNPRSVKGPSNGIAARGPATATRRRVHDYGNAQATRVVRQS